MEIVINTVVHHYVLLLVGCYLLVELASYLSDRF